MPDALVIDLLQPDVARELSARPERLRDLVAASAPGAPVILDEVQRVLELLSVVHAVLESKDRRRFVLTGSSARKLHRGGIDLLGGALSCGRCIRSWAASSNGSISIAPSCAVCCRWLSRPTTPMMCSAYASLYLDQEVRLEGWTRNAGAFARFLEGISFSHAAVLNVANVARDCEVERKTVAAYIEVLEDLLLSFRVPVFTRRAKRETSAHPKFYVFDAGVYRSLRPKGLLDRPEDIEGAALEGLVAQLYFWRTRSGVEVDFVVYGEAGFWAIEVKNAARIRPEDLRGVEAFRADYPQAETLVLYRGTRRERRGGVWIVPVGDFLRRLNPAAILPVRG